MSNLDDAMSGLRGASGVPTLKPTAGGALPSTDQLAGLRGAAGVPAAPSQAPIATSGDVTPVAPAAGVAGLAAGGGATAYGLAKQPAANDPTAPTSGAFGGVKGAGIIKNTGNVVKSLGGAATIGLGGYDQAMKGFDDSKVLNDAAPDNTTAALDSTALAGERVGRFAGGIAGAGLGGSIGSFAGPVGTVLGGLVGGVAGAYAPDLVNKAQNAIFGTDTQLPSDKAEAIRNAPAVQRPGTPPVAPATTPGTPVTGDNVSGFPAAPLSLSSPAPSSNLAGSQPTSVPGIVRNGNSFTNIGTNPDGSNGATSQLPNTGFDLGQANAAQARANAITDSTPQSDPNALFSTTGGRATSFGTPLSAEPRMQTTDGNGLGGLIVAKQAARQQALALQQQSILGDQALRGQDLGLRRQQLGFDNQFRAATLGHTIDHDNATVGLAGQQLQREGLRDQASAMHQRNEEGLAQQRMGLEFGPGSLREREFANTQGQQSLKDKADAEANVTKQLTNSLPQTTDAKGNSVPDTGAVQSHLADFQSTIAARSRQLLADPDPARRAQGQALADRGFAAVQPQDIQRMTDQKAIKEIARSSRGVGPGSSTFVDSDDLSGYTPTAAVDHSLLPNQVKMKNGTVVPRALLQRTNNPNVYFPNTDSGSPQTDRFGYLTNGLRSTR